MPSNEKIKYEDIKLLLVMSDLQKKSTKVLKMFWIAICKVINLLAGVCLT
jgi:hypothetical protein